MVQAERSTVSNNPQDVVELTRQLVQIPSYVETHDSDGNPLPKSERHDENKVANYVADFLTENTNLTVKKELAVDGRYNIIAANSDTPKLIMLGHTDTVRPSEGGLYDQFAAEIHDNRIYGLGAADMKSGVASILSAAKRYKNVPDVMLAFYIDEEYDFAGMKSLVENYGDLKPELIFSADGADMELGHGCRGLIELHGTMRGKAAHAARPHQGVNAINGVVDNLRDVNNNLKQFEHYQLGAPTVNLARLDGGKAGINPETQEITVFEQINSVPDIAKFKVDIRTSSPDLTPETIIGYINDYNTKNGLELTDIKTHHNLGAWYTEKSDLTLAIDAVQEVNGNVEYSDPKSTGFIDLQMLWDATGRPHAAMYGAGPNSVAHQVNEYVEIDSLLKSTDIFSAVMSKFARK